MYKVDKWSCLRVGEGGWKQRETGKNGRWHSSVAERWLRNCKFLGSRPAILLRRDSVLASWWGESRRVKELSTISLHPSLPTCPPHPPGEWGMGRGDSGRDRQSGNGGMGKAGCVFVSFLIWWKTGMHDKFQSYISRDRFTTITIRYISLIVLVSS